MVLVKTTLQIMFLINSIPQFAYKYLQELKIKHHNNDKLPPVVLEEIVSIFGPVAEQAVELLEKCKLIEYRTGDNSRQVYKIGSRSDEMYTIYKTINFCRCSDFYNCVLEERTLLMCKHVLAIQLCEAINICNIRTEVISDSQFVDFLNEQFNFLIDDATIS